MNGGNFAILEARQHSPKLKNHLTAGRVHFQSRQLAFSCLRSCTNKQLVAMVTKVHGFERYRTPDEKRKKMCCCCCCCCLFRIYFIPYVRVFYTHTYTSFTLFREALRIYQKRVGTYFWCASERNSFFAYQRIPLKLVPSQLKF